MSFYIAKIRLVVMHDGDARALVFSASGVTVPTGNETFLIGEFHAQRSVRRINRNTDLRAAGLIGCRYHQMSQTQVDGLNEDAQEVTSLRLEDEDRSRILKEVTS